jgi:hypothetical protein
VRFQVLTAACTKMTPFCDIAPCSLVEVDQRFRGAYCLHHQGDDSLTLMLLAVSYLLLRWGETMSVSNWVSKGPFVRPPS